jgi:hypothetical protein
VLRTDLRNHRRSTEPELLRALGQRDPLALAETFSRTIGVAYAVGRRLLPASDVEALLLDVYSSLWESPPSDPPLERWVRSRCCELALAELHERRAAPATPSAHTLAPELPEPASSYLDTTERALASLSPEDRLAVLRAHDAGIPSSEQDGAAGPGLNRALCVLADPAAESVPDDDFDPEGRLADWVLGLLPTDEAAAIEQETAGNQALAARLQMLRRGRRRLEGLPPTPDLGPRLLAVVLSGGPPPVTDAPASTAADDETVADDGWAPLESGPAPGEEATPAAFDDTPPGGLPVAEPPDEAPSDGAPPEGAPSEGAPPETGTADFRLSDLFDDGDDDTISSVLDQDEHDPGWARPAPPAGEDADMTAPAAEHGAPAGPADVREPAAAAPTPSMEDEDDVWGREATIAWNEGDEEGFERDVEAGGDDELHERSRPSAGVRLLQAFGVLLLLAAGVGLGLFLGQILLSYVRG